MQKRIPSFKPAEFPAAFWKRVAAYILDSLALGIIVIAPFQSIFLDFEEKSITALFANLNISLKAAYVALIMSVLMLAYWAIMDYSFGQTIGKIIMKLKVRSLRGKLTFSQAVFRNLSKLSTILLAADCIYMFAKKQNQRYLEQVTNTGVVEALSV